MADHLADLPDRVRHDRRRTDVEGDVGRVVHDDVVRDLVDQRAPGPDLGEGIGRDGREVDLRHRAASTSD